MTYYQYITKALKSSITDYSHFHFIIMVLLELKSSGLELMDKESQPSSQEKWPLIKE